MQQAEARATTWRGLEGGEGGGGDCEVGGVACVQHKQVRDRVQLGRRGDAVVVVSVGVGVVIAVDAVVSKHDLVVAISVRRRLCLLGRALGLGLLLGRLGRRRLLGRFGGVGRGRRDPRDPAAHRAAGERGRRPQVRHGDLVGGQQQLGRVAGEGRAQLGNGARNVGDVVGQLPALDELSDEAVLHLQRAHHLALVVVRQRRQYAVHQHAGHLAKALFLEEANPGPCKLVDLRDAPRRAELAQQIRRVRIRLLHGGGHRAGEGFEDVALLQLLEAAAAKEAHHLRLASVEDGGQEFGRRVATALALEEDERLGQEHAEPRRLGVVAAVAAARAAESLDCGRHLVSTHHRLRRSLGRLLRLHRRRVRRPLGRLVDIGEGLETSRA